MKELLQASSDVNFAPKKQNCCTEKKDYTKMNELHRRIYVYY